MTDDTKTICKRCGFTEWYAHGLDDMKPDEPNGVFLLDGEEAARNRGPYR